MVRRMQSSHNIPTFSNPSSVLNHPRGHPAAMFLDLTRLPAASVRYSVVLPRLAVLSTALCSGSSK